MLKLYTFSGENTIPTTQSSDPLFVIVCCDNVHLSGLIGELDLLHRVHLCAGGKEHSPNAAILACCVGGLRTTWCSTCCTRRHNTPRCSCNMYFGLWATKEKWKSLNTAPQYWWMTAINTLIWNDHHPPALILKRLIVHMHWVCVLLLIFILIICQLWPLFHILFLPCDHHAENTYKTLSTL